MIVLGIDPGLGACGFALVGKAVGSPEVVILDAGVWGTDAGDTMVRRAGELARDLDGYLSKHAPHAVVTESPTMPRNAASAAKLFAAYGVIRGAIAGRALHVERTGKQWRKLLGLATVANGADEGAAHRERKRMTRALMTKRFPGLEALLRSTPGDLREHAIDALAIACSWTDIAGGGPAEEKANDAEDEEG